jgi:hypothetical protein
MEWVEWLSLAPRYPHEAMMSIASRTGWAITAPEMEMTCRAPAKYLRHQLHHRDRDFCHGQVFEYQRNQLFS